MVLEKTAEKKKQEEDALRKLREEKEKQAKIRHQWRIFMHSRKELAEMEKQEKARKEVEAMKRKLIFEKEEKEKEEKKKEEQRRQEKQKMRDEVEKKRKQKTPKKGNGWRKYSCFHQMMRYQQKEVGFLLCIFYV